MDGPQPPGSGGPLRKTVLLICGFKPGASAGRDRRLQPCAGGGSELTATRTTKPMFKKYFYGSRLLPRESHFRRLFCLLFGSYNRRSSREPSGLASPSSSPFGSAKPACTALTGSVGCTNGRGAKRNQAAYRDQRPLADYGEAARGSHRQTVGKKVSAPSKASGEAGAPQHERAKKNKRPSATDMRLKLRLIRRSGTREVSGTRSCT